MKLMHKMMIAAALLGSFALATPAQADEYWGCHRYHYWNHYGCYHPYHEYYGCYRPYHCHSEYYSFYHCRPRCHHYHCW
jgi:hypothetical protein